MTKQKSTLKELICFGMLGILIFLILSEIGLRLSGITDFPIYETDDQIGYVPMSNQSGALLTTHHWVINDRNMNVSRNWDGGGAADVLLTGDSVVWGGNMLDDPDKLGVRLQAQMPQYSIWPVSAGSWSTENNRVWMRRNPEVINQTEYCVWVLNSGDLQPGSKWRTDTTHPRAKPISSLLYVLNKYAFQKIVRAIRSPPTKESDEDLPTVDLEQLAEFVEQLRMLDVHRVETFVVLYPDKKQRNGEAEALAEYDEFRDKVTQSLTSDTKLIDLLDFADWPTSYYRDGIHPSVSGHEAMAKIIASEIRGS